MARQRRITHPLAARTAAVVPATSNGALMIDNFHWKGLIAYLLVTAASGTGGLKLFVRGYDFTQAPLIDQGQAPTEEFVLNDGGPLVTSIGRGAYVLYPDSLTIPDGSGVVSVAQMVLPGIFDVFVSHGDNSSYTYQVGIELID